MMQDVQVTDVVVGEGREVEKGALISVPAGTRHNLVNTGDKPIRLYTVYAPPETAPGTVHATRAEAMAAEHTQAPVA